MYVKAQVGVVEPPERSFGTLLREIMPAEYEKIRRHC